MKSEQLKKLVEYWKKGSDLDFKSAVNISKNTTEKTKKPFLKLMSLTSAVATPMIPIKYIDRQLRLKQKK